jgi:hypothetical protein
MTDLRAYETDPRSLIRDLGGGSTHQRRYLAEVIADHPDDGYYCPLCDPVYPVPTPEAARWPEPRILHRLPDPAPTAEAER